MNAYAIAPLIATIAYIPLLFTTISSRPWQRRHLLFTLFLTSALSWSFITFLFRTGSFPELSPVLFKLTVIFFAVCAVQFHYFNTSFYPRDVGRWLPFAYISLSVIVALVMLGYVTGDVYIDDAGYVHSYYKTGIVLVSLPLFVVAIRNLHVFSKMYRRSDSPVLRNQVLTLILSVSILVMSTVISLPVTVFPVAHYGNLLMAFILSYAVVTHKLVDIKLVIKKGTAWISLIAVGVICFWLLLVLFHNVFNFEIDFVASLVATLVALCVFGVIYVIRERVFAFVNRAFEGAAYNARQELNKFTNKIHSVFSLKEQGGEMLSLLVKSVNIKEACLLFPEPGSEDFFAQFVEPQNDGTALRGLRLRAGNPIIRYLEKEKSLLPKESLAVLPAFLGLWPQEREEIEAKGISVFMPLISRDRLIAILVLGKKQTGHYSLEDYNIIEDVTGRVAVSMEKEYLAEQLQEREEELSVINNSSARLTSSLEIPEIFGTFTDELKKVVDVSWSSIVLIEETGLLCTALSSSQGSAYQVGEKIPMEGTGTGWVITQKKSFVEPDLSQERYFNTGAVFYELGLRTVAYLPLIAKGRGIGSFIVASKRPHAYSQRQIKLLEQLAAQIAMPLENAQLYARAEKKARVDELTRLFNRRSLDEMIDAEISRHSRYGGVFSLAILDLDSFKAYNDTYGHLSGDRLLSDVGSCISSTIRTADSAFRYGGDEFAILLPHTTMEAAYRVTERVRKKIFEKVNCGDMSVTASIGLASWPDHGISHTDIIAAADATLYQAKRNGGNQSQCATGGLAAMRPDDERHEKENIDSDILGMARALSETADARCASNKNRSLDIVEDCLSMAKMMRLDEAATSRLEICALLHDIGKMNISDAILAKPGSLTAEEWQIIKTHPMLGAEVATRIPKLASCVAGILHHHERYDGTGYPDGLNGDNIPLESRILAIASAFTAMTSPRPYARTLTYEQGLEEIDRCAGTQFDPALVRHFLSLHRAGVENTSKVRR
jgi:diguanylate cyclase (GGDEF)-like protein